MRTRVKICGITRVEDVQAVAGAGADALGLVFYAGSARHVDLGQAQALCRAVPPFLSVVGLFVNAPREQVQAVIDTLPIDLLQFHGDEPPEACTGFGRPYIKGIGMRPGLDVGALMAAHGQASGFLLDAWQPDTHGGGGVTFDWTQVPGGKDRPLILAGGLNAGNVEQAVAQVGPYAVDVSSGVEAGKGIKSGEKIQAFMRGVQRGDAAKSSH